MNSPDSTAPSTRATAPAPDTSSDATSQGGDAMRQFVAKAGDLTQRSVEQWRGQAGAWRDGASGHIRAHPMRSVLIATGAGAVLALLLRALNR